MSKNFPKREKQRRFMGVHRHMN